MARKYQIKRKDEINLADPANKNNRLAYGALFRVAASGNIRTNPPRSAFLLNPDRIEDSKSGNWVENNIPGQSDPILQWVSGGARNLSFTALVTKDTVHFKSPAGTDLLDTVMDGAFTAFGSIASQFAGVNIPPVGDVLAKLVGSNSVGVGDELSIAANLDYYRSLMYPTINEEGVLESSPPLIVLALGKTLTSLTNVNVTGKISPGKHGTPGSTDLWVAKNVSISITKWLPNLDPMEAEVSFQLTQYTMQSRGSSWFAVTDEVSVKKTTTLPSSQSGSDPFNFA